jgi:hypothetical protein
MSTIEIWMLALIGVATPALCIGGVGLVYLAQERAAAKRRPVVHVNEQARARSGQVQDRPGTRPATDRRDVPAGRESL